MYKSILRLSEENLLFFIVNTFHKEECPENIWDVYEYERGKITFIQHNPKPLKITSTGLKVYIGIPNRYIFKGTCYAELPLKKPLIYLK